MTGAAVPSLSFFARVSRLVIPGFAFVSFYSLLVILFASAYRLISVYTPEAHFNVGSAPRGLSFSESIYFSISTVGYGDITPYSSLARVLASLEVFWRHHAAVIRCVGAA